MRHSYLIIAHNEFEILKLLVAALDDERNDIYVHIDKKVKSLPVLTAVKSNLYVLKKRIDVRWGNYSQIKCEYLLWEAAMSNGPYDFYHLISGTHLPLKDQNIIHSFFNNYQGMSLFSNLDKRERDYQEILKLHRFNFFTKTYASTNKALSIVSQFLWKSFIALQHWLMITINDGIQFYWANNWCSLSQDAVSYLIEHKKKILRRYRWTFCGDEWFAPTELMNSGLSQSVIGSDELLYGYIQKSNASVLTMDDYKKLISSGCIFARKFSKDFIDVVNAIIKYEGID